MEDNSLGAYSTSTSNTYKYRVRLETRKVRNHMTRKFSNILHQKKEANTNALQKIEGYRGPQRTTRTHGGFTTHVITINT